MLCWGSRPLLRTGPGVFISCLITDQPIIIPVRYTFGVRLDIIKLEVDYSVEDVARQEIFLSRSCILCKSYSKPPYYCRYI